MNIFDFAIFEAPFLAGPLGIDNLGRMTFEGSYRSLTGIIGPFITISDAFALKRMDAARFPTREKGRSGSRCVYRRAATSEEGAFRDHERVRIASVTSESKNGIRDRHSARRASPCDETMVPTAGVLRSGRIASL